MKTRTDARACVKRGRGNKRASEQGIILIWALMSMLFIAGIIVTGTQSEIALDRLSRHELATGGQARAVAEAGVVDAFAWFRRQQVQPVTNFAPSLDLSASGTVYQFEIHDNQQFRKGPHDEQLTRGEREIGIAHKYTARITR